MDSNSYLKDLKSQLEDDEKTLMDVDVLIKTMKDAGETTATLENQQRTIRAKIAKWTKAIDKNLR